MSIQLDSFRVLRALFTVIIVLAVLNAITLIVEYGFGYDHAKGLVPMFRLNAERNIPTFFSAVLILTTSICCFSISRGVQARNPKASKYWLLLGMVALFLSFDEASHIHEMFDDNKEWTDGLFEPTGVLDGPWVVVYGGLVLMFVLYFFRFYLSLPFTYQVLFGVSGALFVSGAIGVEMIGAAEYSAQGDTLKHEIINSIEEVMEMSGVSLALFGMMQYARQELGWHYIELGPKPSK